MRTVWKTGSASGVPPNYRGRYCTPWREDPDSRFNENGQGIDNAASYPFAPMTLRQFVKGMWRVRSYIIDWEVSFVSFANGFTFSRGGSVECAATALNPSTGSFEPIGPQEEYRLGAGFTFDGDSTTEDPQYSGSEAVIIAGIGGIHQYHCPTAVSAQLFRPLVAFNYTFSMSADSASEQLSFGIVASRTGAPSNGVSRFILPDDYDDSQICVGNAQGSTFFIAPSQITGSVTIRPGSWWEYRDGNGNNPIWDVTTGAQLRDWRTQASRQASGTRVALAGQIPSPSWVA